jgi:hypothetical protein
MPLPRADGKPLLGAWSRSRDVGSSPALLAFAADAGAFAALGGQDVGVAGVGVAPAQVVLHAAGQDGVAGLVRSAQDKGADRPELRLDRGWPRTRWQA